MTSPVKQLRCADYTVAWICALPEIELLPAWLMLDEDHLPPLDYRYNDDNKYVWGAIRHHPVVIATGPPRMTGDVRRLEPSIFTIFPNIEITVLVGIGGGLPNPLNDVHVGDVVVGWPSKGKPACVYYDFGSRNIGAVPDPGQKLSQAVSLLMSNQWSNNGTFADPLWRLQWLEQKFPRPGPEQDRLFEATYQHIYHHTEEYGSNCMACDHEELVQRPQRKRTVDADDELVFHLGGIATGTQPIQDGVVRDKIGVECDGALCVDIETVGVKIDTECLVIRGISDYADSHKNDVWRCFAAGTAAAFTRKLLCIIQPQAATTIGKLTGAVNKSNRVSSHYSFNRLSIKADPLNTDPAIGFTHPSLKLNVAILSNNVALVTRLIASGADVNEPYKPLCRDEDNCKNWGFPVWHAALIGKEMTNLLIQAGADVNARFMSFGTALQCAARSGTLETMELLIGAGADVNAASGTASGADGTALIQAIGSNVNSLEKVCLLLRHGADVNTPTLDGRTTPIQKALDVGHTALVLVFISHGASVANVSLFWQELNDHSYSSISQIMTAMADASLFAALKSIKLDWRVPELPGFKSRAKDAVEGKIFPLVDNLMGQFVLVDDHPGGLQVMVTGESCFDYVCNHSGQDGADLLRCILNNIVGQLPGNSKRKSMAHTHDRMLPCKCVSAISFSADQLEFEFNTKSLIPESLHLILDVVSYFCRAVTRPEASVPLIATSSVIKVCVTPLEDMEAERPLFLHVSIVEEPVQVQESSCWQNLLSTGIVARCDQQQQALSSPGRGLSVSFEDMLALASIDYSAVIGQTIVLIGYRTALLPVEIGDEHVQYHLLVCNSGQMDPFNFPKELEQAVNVADVEELRKKRSFIGWCPEARINLGTVALSETSMPRTSGAQIKERSIQLSGISAGLSILSAVPVQAGPNFQLSGKFVVNNIKFPMSDVYSKILRDTSIDTALLYDTESKRGWIVPKLYMLLHMCHMHMAIFGEHDDIPFASDAIDPKSLVTALDDKGDLVLYGVSPDEFRFRDLLRGLNVNLLTVATKTQTSRSGTLYGYDFVDIVNNPGKGAWMRKINIKNSKSDVIEMANLSNIVVVGAGFQDVIQPPQPLPPLNQRLNTSLSKCISVPEGLDYVIVPVSYLLKLVSGSCKVDGSTRSNEVEIAKGLFWIVSMASFEPCNHSGRNGKCCWHREQTFQELRQLGWLQKKPITNGNRQISLSAMPAHGAVVFGRPQRL